MSSYPQLSHAKDFKKWDSMLPCFTLGIKGLDWEKVKQTLEEAQLVLGS